MQRLRRLVFTMVLVSTMLAPALSSPRQSDAASTTIRFAASGDHGANSKTAASLNKLDSSGVDFYLAIGDLDYREVPTPAAWCDYVKTRLPRLGPSFPFQVLAGNHEESTITEHAACLPDRMSSTLGPSKQYGTEYYFDHPASKPLVRVIMISPALVINGVSYEYKKGSTRYKWVSDAIDTAQAAEIPWIVVGMHKHCTTPGSTSCEIGADLMNMLVSKKVDLVIQGHKHTYMRGKQVALHGACPTVAAGYDPDCVIDDGADNVYTRDRGTIVLINGMFGKGGSSSAKDYFIRAGSGDGFTKFTVTAERIDAQFVNATGSFSDSYSIVPNQAPVFSDPSEPTDHREGQVVSMSIPAVDPEGESVTYSAQGLPPGLSLNSKTGAVTGTVAAGAADASPYSVTVSATDEGRRTNTLFLTWHVRDLTAPETPPSLKIIATTSGVHLDWPDNDEPDLAGYSVMRASAPGGPFTQLHEGLLAVSEFHDDSAPAGATSYYQVAAADTRGNVSPPRVGSVRRSRITFVSDSHAHSSGMTMALPKPDGVATGDVLLATLSVRGSVNVMPPAGWTLVSQVSRTSTLTHQAVFRHTVRSSEPSSYTFTMEGRSSSVGAIVAYRGAQERPAMTAAQANPSSTSIATPSVSVAAADSVLVGLFGIARDTALRPPAGMFTRGEAMLSSGLLRAALLVADAPVGTGSLASRTATAAAPAAGMGQVVVLAPVP